MNAILAFLWCLVSVYYFFVDNTLFGCLFMSLSLLAEIAHLIGKKS